MTPFQLAGEIDATFDGTTCRATTSGATTELVAGLYRVRYTGPAGAPSGVTMVGVATPHTWAELVDWLADVDMESEQASPDWILLGPSVWDATGSATTASVPGAIPAATVGPVCVSGTWPDLTFVPGTPFEVANRP